MMPFAVAVWMLSSSPWDSGASRGGKLRWLLEEIVGGKWQKVQESFRMVV